VRGWRCALQDIGFQNRSQFATDLRGGGILGPLCMLYFCDQHAALLKAVWVRDPADPSAFPFAVISLNATVLTLRAMEEKKLHSLAKSSAMLTAFMQVSFVESAGLVWCPVAAVLAGVRARAQVPLWVEIFTADVCYDCERVLRTSRGDGRDGCQVLADPRSGRGCDGIPRQQGRCMHGCQLKQVSISFSSCNGQRQRQYSVWDGLIEIQAAFCLCNPVPRTLYHPSNRLALGFASL
jgi:hypothetical protein